VKTHEAVDGTKKHRGELLAADGEGITVRIDGEVRSFDLRDVASARTVFVWDKGPRPGKDS
jgi:ribosome maturation factor RimP